MKKIITIFLLITLISSTSDKKEKVDQLFKDWNSNNTPGAAVAIVKDGKILYSKGYGIANLEYDISITPNSIFHIASVSKQFTVFSILLLESQGKLSLDDDIRKYIPEMPDFEKKITLKHLASHTSGLRDQWNLLSMGGWRMDDVITKEHILKLVGKQKELNFNPGDEYLYCNTGFTLLAEVVARISNMSFAEFTKANIFKPLKMNNTLFYDDHQKIVKNRAYSYYSSPDNQEVIKRLKDIKNDIIINGSSFAENAVLYSQDPESSENGGKYTLYKNKPRMVKEFRDVAFSLLESEISEPFETNYGWHIIKVDKIRGQELDIRHILLIPDSKIFKKSVLNYANVGATSLFTSVNDLSLWAMNFSKMNIGNSSIINKMNKPALLNDGEEFGGALGQFIGNYKGLKEIQHGGADAGYRSFLTRFPDQDFAVIVFSNSAEFDAGGLAHKIVDIYLEDKIESDENIKDIKNNSSSKSTIVDKKILKSYEGSFELQPGFIIKISYIENKLFAQATGQQMVSLMPTSDTEFIVEGIEAKIVFIADKDNIINKLKLYQGDQINDAPRVKEFDISSVNNEEFSGEFYSEELSTTYSLKVEDGYLISKHVRLSDFRLSPVSKDVFQGSVWFFGQVEFVRNKMNTITGFKVSNGRVRNLHFKKIN